MAVLFDEFQEKAINAVKNAVVSAGAGSGKTTVLAERFCHLIENNNAQVDEILTLTFTQKAQAEMYEKIYKRLAHSPSPHAIDALSRIDQAVISTLDSFCGEIARNWSEHFGVPPDFAYVDSWDMARTAALDFIIENSDDPALERFIFLNGFEQVLDDCFTDFAVKHVHIGLPIDYSLFFTLQIETLHARGLAGLGRIENAFRLIGELPADNSAIAAKRKMIESLPDVRALFLQEDYDVCATALETIDLKKPGGKANDTLQALKDALDELKAFVPVLLSVCSTLLEKELISDLLVLFSRFAEFYIARKRASGALDFGDVARIALATLLENTTIRAYYKNKFKFIIIDEFQDNNRLQKELLYLIAEKKEISSASVPQPHEIEENKLFFVGDEKQSIYRFRGADVGVFRLLGDEIVREGGEAIHLKTNYRSEPGLISFFNGFFERLMAGASRDYEARFESLVPKKIDATVTPTVTLLYRPYPHDAVDLEFSADESEAYALASFLSDTVRSERLLVRDGAGTRPAGFDDCAVLMRSTSNQIIYERMFRLFDIPFITQGARSLFLEAPVADLYNLLEAVMYPDDRIAYAGLLRSPLVNISDSGMMHVLASNDPPFSPIDSLDDVDQRKYETGKTAFDHVKRQMDRASIRSLVDYFWYECGYRFSILRDERFPNFLEYYGYMTALAGQFDEKGKGASEFLDFLRQNIGKYEKLDDGEILKFESAGVKLLTIHRSKGLQFPVVVLANTGNVGRTAGGSRPYCMSPQFGPTFNIGDRNFFYDMQKSEEASEDLAESKRLLYVALTRAESHIVITGSHNRNNRTNDKTQLNMIMKCLGIEVPCSEGAFTTPYGTTVGISIIADLTPKTYHSHSKKRALRDPADYARSYRDAPLLDVTFPRIEFSVTELNDLYAQERVIGHAEPLAQLPIDRYLTDDRMHAVFGELVHLVLDIHVRKGRCEPRDVPLGLRGRIPQDLFQYMFDAAIECTSSFYASREGRRLETALRIETEYPFLYRIGDGNGNYFVRGVVDLFFVTDTDAVLIDFKTDRFFAVSHYSLQLALYRRVLGELLGQNVSAFVFPFRSGNPVEIDEEIDDDEILRLIREIGRRALNR